MAKTTYTISLVDRVTRTAKVINRSLGTITRSAKMADSAISSIGLIAAGGAVAGIFKLGAELEATQIKFNTLTQSVEKGTKLFNELQDFANATPFSNQALNKNAQMMLAFGIQTEDVIKNLRMLGDISSGDQEKLQSLTLAFSQSQSAGKLMGQDLLQMINAGFNPLNEISKRTGQSMADLKDQMSKGAISADLVKRAFQSAAGPGGRFFNMTNKMAESMAGKWSTVMGKAKFQIANLGLSLKEAFLPILNRAIITIDKFGVWIANNSESIAKWGKAIFEFIPYLLGAVAALKIFNVVASANPIGLIIVGVSALTMLIVKLATSFNDTSAAIDGFFDKFTGIGTIVVMPLQAIYEILRDIVGVFKAFKAGGFIGGMKQIGKSILSFVLLPLEKMLQALEFLNIKFINNALTDLKKFRDGLKFVDTEAATKQAGAAPGFEAGQASATGGLGSIGLSADAKKLQAKGIVSGGIKTFNINIDGITGINTLSTTNIQESADQTGRAITDALVRALGDIKNID